MARRVRHHVNPLRSKFRGGVRPPLALPAGRPVEIELGCADARFLFERAPAHPEVEHLGLEIRQPLVDEVNALAAARGLSNLRAVHCNINVDLPALLPDGAARRLFVLFPDPWFKRRHHKRRLVTPDLVAVLHAKLAPAGELYFASDVFDLALDAMATIEADDHLFENLHGPWSFARDNPYGARSLRELRVLERGLPVWRLCYRRRGD